MTIFVVIAHKGAEILGERVKALYPDHYSLPPSAWFITDNATTAQIRDKLGLNAEKTGGAQGVVAQCGVVSGFAPSDIWEWLKVNLEAKPNG